MWRGLVKGTSTVTSIPERRASSEQRVAIVAAMIDGSVIRERVTGFAAFTAVVLPLYYDPDCAYLSWRLVPAIGGRR